MFVFLSSTISRAWHAARWQLADSCFPRCLLGKADTSRAARSMRPDLARFKGRQTAFLGECRHRCRRFVGRTRKARLTSAGMPWLQISSDSTSYKLYYVNYEIWLDLPAWARASPLSYFLSALFPSFCCASS